MSGILKPPQTFAFCSLPQLLARYELALPAIEPPRELEAGAGAEVEVEDVAVANTPTNKVHLSRKRSPSTLSAAAPRPKRQRGSTTQQNIANGLTLKLADIDSKGETTLKAFYALMKKEHASRCGCGCEKGPKLQNKPLYVRVLKAIMHKHGISEYKPGEARYDS